MTHIDHYDESLEDGNFKSDKRRYPLNENEMYNFPTSKEPLFPIKELRQAFDDYVHKYPESATKIGGFYDYLLRQCKPEDKSGILEQKGIDFPYDPTKGSKMEEDWNVGYEAGKKEAQFKIRQDVKRFLETHSPYNDPNFFHIHLMEVINGFKKEL